MNYEQFRAAWHEALTEAGIGSHLFPPTETLDLRHMSRTCQVYAHLTPLPEVKPFHVSARLSWSRAAIRYALVSKSALALARLDALRTAGDDWLRGLGPNLGSEPREST